MTLVIENASENLANAIKGIVKLEKGARYRKASQEPSDELLEAITQAKEMRQNPHLYKGYSNAKDMLQACLDE